MESPNVSDRTRARRILLARTKILSEHGFYGLLLMHMKLALGDELDTAWASRDTITFNPDFLDDLTDEELCFVLEHEVLHVALEHLRRETEGRDHLAWNLACDIVVNSNILRSNNMDKASITLHGGYGESFHVAPNGEEGFLYTAEEVYAMFAGSGKASGCDKGGSGSGDSGKCSGDALDDVRATGRGGRWDWHIPYDADEREGERGSVWAQRIRDAVESMRARDPSGNRGLIPLCAERMLDELRDAKANWRELLNDFVQEEVNDYSLSEPDRRFPDSPFVLPSYSDADCAVKDILFMVDTSCSISDGALTDAYSEVKGAIEQFDERLGGWLGFFDAATYGPWRFEDIDDLLAIRPEGGGGTRFEAAFRCLDEGIEADLVSCIVILTDGYAPFPHERIAKGIPVLWLLSTTQPHPPWGRVARLGR